jgi:hypothetical protein
MKRLVELFQSGDTEIQGKICDIYAKILERDDNWDAFILDFYLEYEIADLLLGTIKGCRHSDMQIRVLSTLKEML